MDFQGLDFNAYAQKKFGPSARVVAESDHAFSWKLVLNGQTNNLDVNEAARMQYGSRFRAVTIGLYRDDWRAFDFAAVRNRVVPLVVVAGDAWGNIGGARAAVANYLASLRRVQQWYQTKVGRSFRLLDAAIVTQSRHGSAEWNGFARDTDPPVADRELLERELATTIRNAFGDLDPMGGVLCVVPWTGTGAGASGAGAINRAHFVAQPPRIPEIDPSLASPQQLGDVMYSLGHELGHAFGLAHSCAAFPGGQCQDSIMEGTHPPAAILLPQEVQHLLASPFFV
jgi:hypothetical protein